MAGPEGQPDRRRIAVGWSDQPAMAVPEGQPDHRRIFTGRAEMRTPDLNGFSHERMVTDVHIKTTILSLTALLIYCPC